MVNEETSPLRTWCSRLEIALNMSSPQRTTWNILGHRGMQVICLARVALRWSCPRSLERHVSAAEKFFFGHRWDQAHTFDGTECYVQWQRCWLLDRYRYQPGGQVFVPKIPKSIRDRSNLTCFMLTVYDVIIDWFSSYIEGIRYTEQMHSWSWCDSMWFVRWFVCLLACFWKYVLHRCTLHTHTQTDYIFIFAFILYNNKLFFYLFDYFLHLISDIWNLPWHHHPHGTNLPF